MKKLSNEELIKIAKSGYEELMEFPRTYEKAREHRSGDSLSDFIVIELIEGTEGEDDNRNDRLAHAIRLMERAKEQVEGVINALTEVIEE